MSAFFSMCVRKVSEERVLRVRESHEGNKERAAGSLSSKQWGSEEHPYFFFFSYGKKYSERMKWIYRSHSGSWELHSV